MEILILDLHNRKLTNNIVLFHVVVREDHHEICTRNVEMGRGYKVSTIQ